MKETYVREMRPMKLCTWKETFEREPRTVKETYERPIYVKRDPLEETYVP